MSADLVSNSIRITFAVTHSFPLFTFSFVSLTPTVVFSRSLNFLYFVSILRPVLSIDISLS